MLIVRLLGPVHLCGQRGLVVPRGRGQQLLLAGLALQVDATVPASRLAQWVWGDREPRDVRHALQAHMSRLRGTLRDAGLEGDELVAVDGGYRLALDQDCIDSFLMKRLLVRGRTVLDRGDAPEAATILADALGLWRGPPLGDLSDVPELAGELTRLEELRRATWHSLVDARLTLGHHAVLIPELDRAIADDPLDERSWDRLMLALYRSGRQADALKAYHRLKGLLVEELGVDPSPRLRELQGLILRQDPVLQPLALDRGHRPGQDAAKTNLPAELSSFVGRDRELARIEELLEGCRLLTVTGVGGSGKTRLVKAAGRRMLERARDGVWFVGLEGLSDPALVPAAIAEALGIRDFSGEHILRTLERWLRDSDRLLILDNCEHLLQACADVAERLLQTVPDMRVVATSREPLRVDGEVVFRLAPLRLPDEEWAEGRYGDVESVRLFIERMLEGRPDLVLAPGELRTIARICSELDGLPLAIELAAARARVLSLAEIETRLNDRLRWLSTRSARQHPRHRALSAAMDWSYNLLDNNTRLLLRRLAVFRGGFDLAAAKSMREDAGEDDAVDELVRLVDSSLVTVSERRGRTRFGLLETVRRYAWLRLSETGQTPDVCQRHALHFRDVVASCRVRADTKDEQDAFAVLEEEADNLRAALDWTLEGGDPELGVELASSLGDHWLLHGHLDEGQRRIERALQLKGDVRDVVKARLLGDLGAIHVRRDAHDCGRRLLREAIAVAADSGSTASEARYLYWMGFSWSQQEDHARARRLLVRSLHLRRESADSVGAAWSATALGDEAMRRGDIDGAHALYQQAAAFASECGDPPRHLVVRCSSSAELALLQSDIGEAERQANRCLKHARQLGDALHVGLALQTLGEVARLRGHLEQALTLAIEGLNELWRVGTMVNIAGSMERIADILIDLERIEEAARTYGAASAMRQRHETPLPVAWHPDEERSLARLRAHLGPDGFQRAWKDGLAMSGGTQDRAEPSILDAMKRWSLDVNGLPR